MLTVVKGLRECSAVRLLVMVLTMLFADTASADPTLAPDWSDRLPPHPRLLWTADRERDVRDRIAADPVLDATRRKIIDAAERMVGLEPVERILTGRRLLPVSRSYLKRTLYLATAWRMTGDRRFVQQAQREMLAAAAFDDWNPKHFLDVAEMTAALAIGFDWCHDALDDDARDAIRSAILDKGLHTSFIPDYERRFANRRNNWSQVCNAGLVLGALAVADHEPELAAKVIERAAAKVPNAMKAYAPDGAFPEGPSYWYYGTSFNVILIAALVGAIDDDMGLLDQLGFLATADYWLHVASPTGQTFNYGDSKLNMEPAVAQAWLAQRRGEHHLLHHEPGRLEAIDRIDQTNGDHRLLPLVLIWAPALSPDQLPRPHTLSYLGRGANPVAMHRTGWDRRDTLLGLKAGTADVSHGHLDVGSFMLEARGVRWAVDLGAQNYTALEAHRFGSIWKRDQNSSRWKVLRYTNHAHSTLTVDGLLQVSSGLAPIEHHVAMGQGSQGGGHSVMDLTPVYAGQLAAARRGGALEADGRVVIQDEVTALADRPLTTVRWSMVTPAEPVSLGEGVGVLEKDGRRLRMRLIGLAEPPRIQVWPLTPIKPWDEENPGIRAVGFEVTVPAGASARWAVVLEPADDAGDGVEPISLTPLEAWTQQ